MKKGLLVAAVAALTFALAAPVTVFAVDGETNPSPDKDKYQIKIDDLSATGNADVKVGMTGEEVDKLWGSKIGPGYEVVFVGEAYVTPATTDKTILASLTLDVKASDFKGDIFVHWKQNQTAVDQGATVKLVGTDLSPVCVVKKVSTVPNTGDSNNNVLWISALVIALVCGGAAFAMRKSNA